MKRQDWVVRQVKALGYTCEKSAIGYWVEFDWDYSGYTRWELFSSWESIREYFKRNGWDSV